MNFPINFILLLPSGQNPQKNSLKEIHSYRLLFRRFCPLGNPSLFFQKNSRTLQSDLELQIPVYFYYAWNIWNELCSIVKNNVSIGRSRPTLYLTVFIKNLLESRTHEEIIISPDYCAKRWFPFLEQWVGVKSTTFLNFKLASSALLGVG